VLQQTLDSNRHLLDQHHRLIQVVPAESVKAENTIRLESAMAVGELSHCMLAAGCPDSDTHSAGHILPADLAQSRRSAVVLGNPEMIAARHTPVADPTPVYSAVGVVPRRPPVSAVEEEGRLAAGEGT
jgi:hypothetical protein